MKTYRTFKKLYTLSVWKGDRRESNLEVTKEIWMAEESKEKREQTLRLEAQSCEGREDGGCQAGAEPIKWE